MDRIRRLHTLGLVLIAAAAAFGLVALEHMRTLAAYGYVCGGAAPHCAACYASVVALALGVGVLMLDEGLSCAEARVRATPRR
jgi:hypothetical protein